ncbi:MAG: glycosyltransferase family 4 protein, partial [Candidatus Saccharibacteria bacterium]|nr:glycosyltransferase family 4 protein [Rhodoferax sp.]
MPQVLQRIALQLLPPTYWRQQLAGCIQPIARSEGKLRQLLVDVSVIALGDARTGIQRVVRNLYKQLLHNPPPGYQVRPVMANLRQGYAYLPPDFLDHLDTAAAAKPQGQAVQTGPGDIFFGLDLAARIVRSRIPDLLAWKRQGTRLIFMVYDLLPVLHPSWFNPRNTYHLTRWLRTLAILADDVVCISHTVRADFNAWMAQKWGLANSTGTAIASHVIQLGADANGFLPDAAQGPCADYLPAALNPGKAVLMVGTLEPRKGHADVLNAFETLWALGDATQLVIAGKKGWKIDALIARLQNHPEAGQRLHWVNSPSESALLALYQRCNGLIMASKGEGFGLPIKEAQFFGLPVLARALPIFYEVAG